MSPQLLMVLVGVFLSVLLAAWAIGTTTLNWLTPEQREIRRLSQGRSDMLTEEQWFRLTLSRQSWNIAPAVDVNAKLACFAQATDVGRNRPNLFS